MFFFFFYRCHNLISFFFGKIFIHSLRRTLEDVKLKKRKTVWSELDLHIAFDDIERRNRRVGDAAAQHPTDRTRRVIRRRVHSYFLIRRGNHETGTVR